MNDKEKAIGPRGGMEVRCARCGCGITEIGMRYATIVLEDGQVPKFYGKGCRPEASSSAQASEESAK
jgi:hypothetical protein